MCVGSALIESGAYVAQGLSDNSGAKQQAKLLEAEGRSAVMSGNYDASRIREEGRRIEGANRANLGASGVDLGSASAVELAMENARNTEMDALLAVHGGGLQKWGKDFEAKQVRKSGRMSLINSSIKGYATTERAVFDSLKAGG